MTPLPEIPLLGPPEPIERASILETVAILPENQSMNATSQILALWNTLGGDSSVVGPQVGVLGSCPDGVGYYNQYRDGSIYWTPSTGAHEVHGDIRGKWEALSWERGFLGYPLTDETGTPDGVGRYNHFQGGSIYWTPSTGAHEVHGDIRGKWEALSWERGFLGYPLTDETGAPDGVGRYNDFQGGTIYWSPLSGARESQGPLRTQISFDAGAISFADGIAAGGGAQIVLTPDGNVQFQGWMHDSGAAAYNYSVAVAIIDADTRAYTVGHTGNVAGTFESGSRDDPWNGSGPNPLVAANWRSLNAHAEAHFQSNISTDIGALLNSILTAVGTTAAVIALIIA